LEVCPVDCIIKVPGVDISVLQSFCEIDVESCVGCEVCVAIPTKKSDPYRLTVCPWDAIEMVPTVQVAQYVAIKGGPPESMYANWDRLVIPAQRMAELAAESWFKGVQGWQMLNQVPARFEPAHTPPRRAVVGSVPEQLSPAPQA
jgi:electron transport complex protein RnfB